jgi:hypothetical protein
MATDLSIRTKDVLHFSIFNSAYRCLSHQARLVWIVSAGISLLSTRYLLVEFNFHYPLLLYLSHLSAVAYVVILQYFLVPKPHNADIEQPARNRTGRGSLMATGAMCFAALSMVCMLQAIVKNRNLPTLVMLTVGCTASDFWPDTLTLHRLLRSSLMTSSTFSADIRITPGPRGCASPHSSWLVSVC